MAVEGVRSSPSLMLPGRLTEKKPNEKQETRNAKPEMPNLRLLRSLTRLVGSTGFGIRVSGYDLRFRSDMMVSDYSRVRIRQGHQTCIKQAATTYRSL